MQVKRVQDYISKEWFDETDGSYFERLNSRLQILLKKDYPDLRGHDFISNISLLDYRLVFLDEVIANANEKNEHVRETVHDVTKSLLYEDQDIQEQLDSRITFGQKVADEVADLVDLGLLSCHSLLLWLFGWGLMLFNLLGLPLISIHLFC